MPHIILFFLLLIASSPSFTLGDEPASWGSIKPGPSESECRPYIEKALQGASIPDSINELRDSDDVGESEHPEEDATITEAPEDVPPDLLEKTNISEELSGETETPSETESNENNIQPAESAESIEDNLETQEEGTQENNDVENEETAESGDSLETNTNEEETRGNHEFLSSEQNEDSHFAQEEEKQSDEQPAEESTSETDPNIETETESTQEDDAETDSKSAELESEADRQSETESTEEAENIISNESEAELNILSENNEADTSKEKEEAESEEAKEGSEEEKGIEEKYEGQHSDEAKKEDIKDESLEAADESDIGPSGEEIQEESEKTVASVEQVAEDNQSEEAEASEKESQEIEETLSEDIIESPVEVTSKEDILEKESIEDKTNVSDDQNDSEVPSDDLTTVSAEKEDTETQHKEEDTETQHKEEDTETQHKEEDTETQHKEEDTETQHKEEDTNQDSSIVETAKSGDVDVEHLTQDKADEIIEEKLVESDSKEEITTEDAPIEGDEQKEEDSPEEELSMLMEIPENLRPRDHMAQILRLGIENEEIEKALAKIAESTLRELKKLYDAAIKPLEILYKYRDLSNRHFGDPEIFSKPLILFMGPWSGGKSTIINYLLENEYKKTALRTGAEPSPAYFNIVMWGENEEVLDGTQLAADWTFSGLQKFGQGLLDRLRGLKLNHPLLEKVNIVEIPGILEIRKQVERLFPFNDACQWFIDRADIIFLVYDPSKLDVGPETEAILDQLKGREMQTKIILNKADQVKPEELMRVQGTLIWNISPLMSSTEPPVMYSTSLWSIPYESGAPTRLLYAQERAFLKDLRDAIDKRVENKIASARRFAVRVRNHAKMVDCYLTTYYNHKSFFGNKKKISDDIIEHPQNYHIYEGLSTLTNISRYDLPDPDVYRDFFRLNPVYEFQQLSSTCTYFRGCPINRLDVAIAYDLPELVGKYKKKVEEAISYSKK